MTTFKIMSDLHLEFQEGREHEFTVPYDGEDALLLVGDVQCGMVLGDWFVELLKHRPVFYLLGNHEYYHYDFDQIKVMFEAFEQDVNAEAKNRCYGHQLFCLQCRSVLFKDSLIFGATLWTDMEPHTARAVQYAMNDYQLIKRNGKRLLPSHTIEEHHLTAEMLSHFIDMAHDKGGNVVVLTHHAPSYRSVENQYLGDALNAAYANRLDALVEKTTLWVHGHTHHSYDYRIGAGRVVCNPRGYYPRHLNKDFNPHLLVTV